MPQAGIYWAAFSVSLKSRYSRYTPSNNQNQRKSDLKSLCPGHPGATTALLADDACRPSAANAC